jgi:hypothetical protein
MQLRLLPTGEKQIEFGTFGHSSAKVRLHIEKVHEYLNTLRFDVSSLNLGNHSFPTQLGNSSSNSSNFTNSSTPTSDPKWMRSNLILGGDPYITFETPYMEDIDDFLLYMNVTYPEIKMLKQRMMNNQTIILGISQKRRCIDVKLARPMANFTFNTSKEHQFHIN